MSYAPSGSSRNRGRRKRFKEPLTLIEIGYVFVRQELQLLI
jgi:hypothetical protein